MPISSIIKFYRKAYTNFAAHIYDVPARMLALLILTIFTAIPYTGIDIRILKYFLIPANLMAILAVSWDLLVGRTGLISLGHALFYGAGAYGTAILYKYFGWPFWVTIPLSILIGVITALIIGIPCLKIKGPYLALVTMAFPLAIVGFLYYYRDIFGGETGIPKGPWYLPKFFPGLGYYDQVIADYYLSLALLTISSIIIYKIAASKTGIIFVSILDDELGSKACGINVAKYKLMSFVISGLFGTLAGSIYAHMIQGTANPRYFLENTALIPIANSIIPIVATILGGIGTIYGPIFGTYIYYTLDVYVFPYLIGYLSKIVPGIQAYAPNLQILIFMTIIVFMIIKWPRGLARTIIEKLEDLEEPREIEQIEKERAKRAEKG